MESLLTAGCRFRSPALVLLALVLVAGACGEDDETVTTTAAPASSTTAPATTSTAAESTTTTTEPPYEPLHGVLTVGLTGNLSTANFWAYDQEYELTGGPTRYALEYMGMPFLHGQMVPDFALNPWLAAAPWELAQEGDRWTITVELRDGFLWSDGEEVTADDYLFTMGVIEEFGLNSGDLLGQHPITVWDDPDTPEDEEIRAIESVEALDDHTVKITFTPTEYPPGTAYSVMKGSVMPEHFWGPVVEACRSEEDPRGCLLAADGLGQPGGGPLILDSWEPGVGATLVANPNYYYRGVTHTAYNNGTHTYQGGIHDLDETMFGEPDGGVFVQFTHGPFVEEVRLVEYGSEEAAWDAFIRGDVDYVAGDVPQAYRERILSGSLPDVEWTINPSDGFRYLAFNLRRAPMDDLAFRQALAIVLDREAIIDSVPEGSGIPRYSIVPPQNPFWYTDDIIRWGHGMTQPERVEEAAAVLADAGYTWTTRPQAVTDAGGEHTGEIIAGEGLTQPDGTPMPTISLLTPIDPEDRLRQVQGEWIARFAAPLGITIDWQPTDFDALSGLVLPPTADGTGWDMYTLGWGGGDPIFPCFWHQMLLLAEQDSVSVGGWGNTSGYSNPEFEALVPALLAASWPDESRSVCFAMERHLTENLPYIVLWSIPVVEAWRSHIEFPFTQVLDGINYFRGLFDRVRVNEQS